jgi:hypothetical protein
MFGWHMNTIMLPTVITQKRFKTLKSALQEERAQLQQAILDNQANREAISTWWLARSSNVLEFWVIDAPENNDFYSRLEMLVGLQNVAHYRPWLNATRYLVPLRFEMELKMLSEPRSLKRINNSKLTQFRRELTGSPTGILPWESPSDLVPVQEMLSLLR